MNTNRNIIIGIYTIAIIFIIASLFGIYNESFIITLVPFALLLCLLAFLALDKLLLIIMFCVPLSIELSEFVPKTPINMSLPTEPFLFLTMGIFLLKLLTERKFDKEVLKHPVSICIYVYLGWLFFTSMFSEMPIVSFKYLLTRVWFIICFYFIVTQFVVKEENITKYIIAYTLGFIIVIAYTLSKHILTNFSQQTAYLVMNPFFKDHTSYGAALALLIPALFVVIRRNKSKLQIRFFYMIILFILFVALIFSYTRAAWIGIAFSAILYVILKLRIKIKVFIIAGLAIILAVAPFYDDIIYKMSKNTEVSSSDLMSHIKSISNISSDDSNKERINRWKCAYRMFEDRPITGFGPGTYMFLYAPFQHSEDRTIISTNAANCGNAHSEYLGLLAETGLIGSLAFIAILIVTLISGFDVYNHTKNSQTKDTVLFLMLGLITYYLHAFMNDFLDTDKIASLFWGFIAIIVMFHIKEKTQLHDEIQS